MTTSTEADALKTSSTLLLRLKQTEVVPREIAWQQFHTRYAPVITAFARWMQARPSDIDDVVQDVMVGFYAASPTFVYNPAKGRFRDYLKRCTLTALMKQVDKNRKYQGLPIEVADEVPEVTEAWDTEWAHQQMRRAIEEVRLEYNSNVTFQAFELNVLANLAAPKVAMRLGIRVNNVYKAKERITAALREKIKTMEDEEG